MDDFFLPSAVTGPREGAPFRREAAICFSVRKELVYLDREGNGRVGRPGTGCGRVVEKAGDISYGRT